MLGLSGRPQCAAELTQEACRLVAQHLPQQIPDSEWPPALVYAVLETRRVDGWRTAVYSPASWLPGRHEQRDTPLPSCLPAFLPSFLPSCFFLSFCFFLCLPLSLSVLFCLSLSLFVFLCLSLSFFVSLCLSLPLFASLCVSSYSLASSGRAGWKLSPEPRPGGAPWYGLVGQVVEIANCNILRVCLLCSLLLLLQYAEESEACRR